MASTKTDPPTRPLPPPPSPPVLPLRSQSTARTSTLSPNVQDASKLGVPASARPSGRASPQFSQVLSVPPLGPPPSLPLPDLPPFPSPVVQQVSNTRVRTIDAPPLRPSLPRRVSDHAVSEFSPASPTTSIRSGAESAVSTHVARRVASSASLGRRPPRPLSTASLWSVASANSHLSAASEALGQSMAELDRDADAMGILLTPGSSRAEGSSRSYLSRSLGSSSAKRRGPPQRPSLPSSNSTPAVPSLNSEPPSAQPSLRQSSSTPLLSSTLRKVSLRSLYPPPDSTGLPSPNEEEERDDSYAMLPPTPHPTPHPFGRSHTSIARSSQVSTTSNSSRAPSSPARLSLASSSMSSRSSGGSISGGSVSYQSAASTSNATLDQMRGRSRLIQKAGRVAAAQARAAEEGRVSPDVVDMLEATPRPARKKSSSSSLAASTTTSQPTKSKDRTRSKSRPRYCSGDGAPSLKPVRGPASNGHMHLSSSIMSTLSNPVSIPLAPPPSSFVRSRHQLSEIARRATEDIAAVTVVSPTESTGEDVWMTADCGEGVESGGESESSIDLHTPLPSVPISSRAIVTPLNSFTLEMARQILVRDGMLSPTSTVVRSLSATSDPTSTERSNTKSSRSGDKAPHTDVRKRRHRDGKLLREGVGLTTGLGWSDSEDEDSPGPMRRRLSRMLLRRVGSVASSLVAANAESAAANDGSQSPTLSAPAPLPQPSAITARKQNLRKASSSLSVLGSPELRPDAPRSALSANPSLDAKVKALLARAEAYKKETQARMVPVIIASSAPSAGSGSTRRPSLASNSTSTTYSSPSTPGSSRPISLTRSLKDPTVSEVADDVQLAAAEAAYRHSKEVSASLRYSTGSSASRGGKAPRASSSVGSRDSIYSTASSGVTEFGTFAPSASASHRTRSRAVSASNGASSGAPPSAFCFSPAMLPLIGMPKHSIGVSASTLSSTARSLVSASMPSPSTSTAPSARQSLLADLRLPDEGDTGSRIAKLSNASTTSISSAAHSLTPSLFSINSMNSADSSCTSDSGGLLLPLTPAGRSETVNVIPPSPTEIDGPQKSSVAPSLRAPKKQLLRRSSLAPLVAPNGEHVEMSNSLDKSTNKSAQPRKSNTHPPQFSPGSSKLLPYTHTTHRGPMVPQSTASFPSSRLRASTASHPLSTPIS